MSELPKGWKLVQIDEVSEVVSGGTPKSTNASFYSENHHEAIAWITPADLSGYKKNSISHGRRSITKEGYDSCSAKLMPKGSVLFSSRAPVGYVVIAENEICTNQGFKSFVPFKQVDSQYLYYYLKSIKHLAESLATGTTFKELSGKVAKTLPFPLAPLAEQKRIVEKLDEVLAQVDIIKARLDGIPELLKRFRQSVLASAVSGKLTEEWRVAHGALGQDLKLIEQTKTGLISAKTVKKDLNFELSDNIFDIPDSWAFIKLKSLSLKITDGEHKTPKREETGRYLLSARNIRDGYLCLENVDYVGEEEYQKLRKRCDPNKGDILISCSGSVGRVSLVDADDQYVMVRSAALVKVIDDFLMNSYLVHVLQSPELQKRIEESSKSTAQSNLFLGPIKELEIPLPPLAEQKEIVRLVDQYFAFADTIEAQVKKAQARIDNLTQSILAKAFRGELVPQDPNDEPAEVLLKRIAKARAEAEQLAKVAKKAAKAS